MDNTPNIHPEIARFNGKVSFSNFNFSRCFLESFDSSSSAVNAVKNNWKKWETATADKMATHGAKTTNRRIRTAA